MGICSADQVVEIVQIVAHSLPGMLETSLVDNNTTAKGLHWNVSSVLEVSLFLELRNRGRWGILFPPVKWIIFLRDLESTDRDEE